MEGSIAKKTIYVLALEKQRYYIGATNKPDNRILSHFSASGSKWTQTYKPVKVIETIEGDVFDEDKYTKMYMHKYGINKVRGASYCTMVLTSDQIASIGREFKVIDDLCFYCGNSGHFAIDCPTDKNKKKVEEEDEGDDYLQVLAGMNKVTISLLCKRCGRNNHTIETCYAKTTFSGKMIPPEEISSDSI